METSKSSLLAWLAFGVLSLIWGSSFILMKLGLESFSYVQIGLLRVAFGFWFMALIAFPKFLHLKKKDTVPLLAVGLFGNMLPYLLFPLAISKLASGLVGVLNSMVPLFTMIIGAIWFKNKFGSRSVIGVLLGFAGAIILLLPGIEADPERLIYGLLPILANVFYAISINIIGLKLNHLGSLAITLLSLSFVGIPATLLLFSTDFISIMQDDPEAWKNLGYVSILGMVGTGLAVILFNQLIKMSGGLFAASVTYAIPVVALLWGLLFGENIGPEHFIGMSAILGGVYLVNKRKRRQMAAEGNKKAP